MYSLFYIDWKHDHENLGSSAMPRGFCEYVFLMWKLLAIYFCVHIKAWEKMTFVWIYLNCVIKEPFKYISGCIYSSFPKTYLQIFCFYEEGYLVRKVSRIWISISFKLSFKDSHREKAPSNKTPALTKSTNLNI